MNLEGYFDFKYSLFAMDNTTGLKKGHYAKLPYGQPFLDISVDPLPGYILKREESNIPETGLNNVGVVRDISKEVVSPGTGGLRSCKLKAKIVNTIISVNTDNSWLICGNASMEEVDGTLEISGLNTLENIGGTTAGNSERGVPSFLAGARGLIGLAQIFNLE